MHGEREQDRNSCICSRPRWRERGHKSTARLRLLMLLVLIFLWCVPCFASYVGVYHIVGKESLEAIVNTYKIPRKNIIKANYLKPPYKLKAGGVLFIPGAKKVIDVPAKKSSASKSDKIAAKPGKKTKEKVEKKQTKVTHNATATRNVTVNKTTAEEKKKASKSLQNQTAAAKKTAVPTKQKLAEATKTLAAPAKSEKFILPVAGKIIENFGKQPNGMFYNGIKIAVSKKDSVRASNNGAVIYAANMKGYGSTVIMKHAGGFATVYTNLAEINTKLKQQVKKGGAIGVTEDCKNKKGCYITFEVRHKNKAVDPLNYAQEKR